jgi:hypothetical protein
MLGGSELEPQMERLYNDIRARANERLQRQLANQRPAHAIVHTTDVKQAMKQLADLTGHLHPAPPAPSPPPADPASDPSSPLVPVQPIPIPAPAVHRPLLPAQTESIPTLDMMPQLPFPASERLLQPVPAGPIPTPETGPRPPPLDTDDLDHLFTGGPADGHDTTHAPLSPSGPIDDESMPDVAPAPKVPEAPSDADLARLLNAFLVDTGKGGDAGGAVDGSTLGALANAAILGHSSNQTRPATLAHPGPEGGTGDQESAGHALQAETRTTVHAQVCPPTMILQAPR